MSGTEDGVVSQPEQLEPPAQTEPAGELTGRASYLTRISAVLQGEVAVDGLAAVAAALEPVDTTPVESDRIAFCLDADTILGIHRSLDIVDYLAAEHQGLLVLPAQVVQDFWNNTQATVETAEKIRDAYEALCDLVGDLEPEYSEFKSAFEEVLTEFATTAGQPWSPDFRDKVAGPFATLAERAVEPRFPRSRLLHLGQEREATRTPPGGASGGRGHLYVWAEFLLGLLEGRDNDYSFELAVLVTENKAGEWGAGGQAHPSLVAEMAELLGVRFELWGIADLQKFAGRATAR